jgi:hypothetical protein
MTHPATSANFRRFDKRLSNAALRTLAAALCAAGFATPALAVDRTWFGGNGTWDVGTNWSPTGAPGSSDLSILSAGTSTLSFAAAVAGFNITGGRLTGAGNLIVSGTTTWTGGEIGGGGGNLIANGPLSISGGGNKGGFSAS